MGFTEPIPSRGLLVRSYRTVSPLPHRSEDQSGGLLSVALSIGFTLDPRENQFAHRPAVSWHPALWCPDFPHTLGGARPCPFPGQIVAFPFRPEEIQPQATSSGKVSPSSSNCLPAQVRNRVAYRGRDGNRRSRADSARVQIARAQYPAVPKLALRVNASLMSEDVAHVRPELQGSGPQFTERR